MKVKALRGVCIGVDRHLTAGDTVDLEPGLVTYLVSIGAVQALKDEPPPPPTNPEPAPPEAPPALQPKPEPKAESTIDSTPAKPGKKEK